MAYEDGIPTTDLQTVDVCSDLQAQIAQEVDTRHIETYEETWLRRLSGGQKEKADAIRGTPLFTLALYGMQHFNPPNGNKGRSYHDRNLRKKEKQ